MCVDVILYTVVNTGFALCLASLFGYVARDGYRANSSRVGGEVFLSDVVLASPRERIVDGSLCGECIWYKTEDWILKLALDWFSISVLILAMGTSRHYPKYRSFTNVYSSSTQYKAKGELLKTPSRIPACSSQNFNL